MNKIFIEAKDKRTSEYHFIKTIIDIYFPEKEVDFICMNGIGNLFNETNINQISQAQIIEEQTIVLADADTVSKGYGYTKRKKEIEDGMHAKGIHFPYFLYPDNHHDGEVEILMESAARRNLHSAFFDCFEDYERCVSGIKDNEGHSLYNVPNLKGKQHTYINAQKLNGKLNRRAKSGDWLFDNNDYWDLNVETLCPLKDFLATNLK